MTLFVEDLRGGYIGGALSESISSALTDSIGDSTYAIPTGYITQWLTKFMVRGKIVTNEISASLDVDIVEPVLSRSYKLIQSSKILGSSIETAFDRGYDTVLDGYKKHLASFFE